MAIRLYVATYSDGLQIIDISTPASPSLISNYNATLSAAVSVTLSSDGNTAYAAGKVTGGLHIIDISTPASPSFIGMYDTTGAGL